MAPPMSDVELLAFLSVGPKHTGKLATVIIDGTATISEELEDVAHWAGIIGGRYLGAERAEEFGRRTGVPGELLVRVRPTNIVAMTDLAG